MAYTQEEIARERERRRRLKAGIKEEPETVEEGDLGAYEKYVKPLAAGAAQGLVNTGVSAVNALSNYHYGKNHPLRQMGGDPTIPHLKLEKYLPEDYSKGAVLAGEILAPGGAILKGAQKLSKVPTAFKGIPGFAEKTARNAGLGYLVGEQQNEEGESYGRGISAALSGGIPAFASITNKAVGKKIVDTFNKEKKELKEGYKKLFDKAAEKGVDTTTNVLSQNDIQDWVKDIPKKYRKSVERYFSDPTLVHTQKAQSDMGAYARELQHSKEINGHLPDELERRLERLTSTRERMKEEIVNALMNNRSTSGLGWKYLDLTDQFREKLGPYMDVTDINKAVAGQIDPADLAKSLRGKGAHAFREAKGHEHPELEINRWIAQNLGNKYVKGGALGAGAVGSVYLANKLMQGGNKNGT